MFYKPKLVADMWDTWLYYHEGKHYLFYLHMSDGKKWDGISLAISTNGVHFEEIGPIITKREDADWLGTGSTWRIKDGFAINFSEDRNGVQNIFFARSTDLKTWTILGDEYRSEPDPKWYDNTPAGRWDCIWALPKTEGGFYGYLTARPWNKIRGMRFESVGMIESEDGLFWHNIAPPEIRWGDWPEMNVGEVGAIEKVNDKYYLLLGCNEQGLGGRQISGDMVVNWGMYMFISEHPQGPFYPVKNAFRFLVTNWSAHFCRFYRTPRELLVNHHAIEKYYAGTRCSDSWMAPIKNTMVDDEGNMRLSYWKKNDACKGQQKKVNFLSTTRVFPTVDVDCHIIEEHRMEIDEPVRGGIYLMQEAIDTDIGAVIEGYVTHHPSSKRWGGLGFYFEHGGTPGTGCGIMLETRNQTEFAEMNVLKNCWPWYMDRSFNVKEKVMTGITPGIKSHLRILFRKTMLEVYLDDMLVQCYSLYAKPSGRWGFICESGKAIFEDFTVWSMNF